MRIFNTIWLVVMMSFAMLSCMELGFREAMPLNGTDIAEFPVELQGWYVSINDSKDTMEVKSTSVSEDRFALDGKNVIRKFGKYYVCNQKKLNRWNIALIKETCRGFALYSFDIDDSKHREIIRELTSVTEIKDEDGGLDYLLIDPSNEEFSRLVKSKAFVRVEKFRRIK